MYKPKSHQIKVALQFFKSELIYLSLPITNAITPPVMADETIVIKTSAIIAAQFGGIMAYMKKFMLTEKKNPMVIPANAPVLKTEMAAHFK